MIVRTKEDLHRLAQDECIEVIVPAGEQPDGYEVAGTEWLRNTGEVKAVMSGTTKEDGWRARYTVGKRYAVQMHGHQPVVLWRPDEVGYNGVGFWFGPHHTELWNWGWRKLQVELVDIRGAYAPGTGRCWCLEVKMVKE